jgi:pimeloyl-ACP methyl ester carboxylesterase
MFRARFAGISDDWWIEGMYVPPDRVEARIRTETLAKIAALFNTTDLDVSLYAEEVPSLTLASVPGPHSRIQADRTHSAGPLFNDPACRALPSGAQLPDYAPCNSAVLHELRPGQGGAPAIVFVHGWNPDVVTWRDYYREQGITCQTACSIDPTIERRLPGKAYFINVLNSIAADIRFANNSLWLFNYESFNSYQTVGYELSQRLEMLPAARILLVGHSMGGLVARSAVQEIERLGKGERIVGLVTLGTPHLGSLLPLVPASFDFAPAVTTLGGQSLTITLPRTELAALRAYGGDILGRVTPVNSYSWTGSLLCLIDNPNNCHNDGVVTVESALLQGSTEDAGLQRFLFANQDHDEIRPTSGSSNVATRVTQDMVFLLDQYVRTGFGTPVVDGDIRVGEWSEAGVHTFGLALPDGSLVPAALYVMNDARNIYIGVRVKTKLSTVGTLALRLFLNGTGVGPAGSQGDDVLDISVTPNGATIRDSFFQMCGSSCPTNPIQPDSVLGGRNDATAFSTAASTLSLEIMRPLNSGDPFDPVLVRPGRIAAGLIAVAVRPSPFASATTIPTYWIGATLR